MEALSCYLFIHLNHIPFIRTSLSLIFYFIIQILFLYPDRHERSSCSSGIWIFPRLQASFWVLILNSDLLHEIQFPYRNIFPSSSDIKRRNPQKGKTRGKNSQYQEYFCGTVSGFLQKASSSRPFPQSPFPDLPFIQAAVPGCFCIAWTHPAFCHLPCR